MQRRPKVIFGVSTAVGALIAATGILSPGPASAATTPTFNVPPIGVGWGDVVLTGTAAPNVPVTLHERAFKWGHDVQDPAGLEAAVADTHPTTVTSSSSGAWAITRPLDSGFVFSVESQGLYSRIVKAPLRVGVAFTATPGAAGGVNFVVRASPDQPGIDGVVQRYTSSGWTTVASGQTDETTGDDKAEIITSASGQPAGLQYYRAFLSETAASLAGYADDENLLLANYSANRPATVAGSSPVNGPVPPANPTPAVPSSAVSPPAGGGNPAPSPSTTTSKPPVVVPSPSKTTSKPATPKPTTTTKPPVAKPPTAPVGSIQFTRIQYNAPGKDSNKNASINGEYFKLTNKMRKTTISLTGWTVRDRAGHLYRFTTSYSLKAGQSIVVKTGKGSNTSATRYWGKAKHVWNNGGDTAALRTNLNKTIDTCNWTKPGKGYTTC